MGKYKYRISPLLCRPVLQGGAPVSLPLAVTENHPRVHGYSVLNEMKTPLEDHDPQLPVDRYLQQKGGDE